MSGDVTLVILEKEKTRAFARYKDPELALLAGDFEPDCRAAKDWVILGKDSPLTQLGHVERTALLRQFGITAVSGGKVHEEKAVMDYLLKFEPVRETLSEEAQEIRKGKRKDRADDHRPQKEKTDMASKKTKGGKVKETTKAMKKMAADAAAKKAKANGATTPKTRAGSDGLGREGTPARFIREEIKAGGDNAKIAEKAAKKFGNNAINASYVAWYRNKMKKDGLIKD